MEQTTDYKLLHEKAEQELDRLAQEIKELNRKIVALMTSKDDEVICKNCEGQGVITYNPNLNPNSFEGMSTGRCTRCNGTGIASKEDER